MTAWAGSSRLPWQSGAISLLLHAVALWGLAGIVSLGGDASTYRTPRPLFANLKTASAPSTSQPAETAAPVTETQSPASTSSPQATERPSQTDTSATRPPDPVGAGAPTANPPAPDFSDYLPASLLDVPPMPVSAPDTHYLDGMLLDAAKMTVHLYIDAHGAVRDVLIDLPEDQQEAAEPIRTMFLVTTFVPGRKNRMDVPSVIDLQIDLSDLITLPRAG